MLGASLQPVCVCVSWPVCAQCHWPFGFRDHLAQESHFTGGYWGLEEWGNLSKPRYLPWRRPKTPGSSEAKSRVQLQRPLGYGASWVLGMSPFSGLLEMQVPSEASRIHPPILFWQPCLFPVFSSWTPRMQRVWVIPLWTVNDQSRILVRARLGSHSEDGRKSQGCPQIRQLTLGWWAWTWRWAWEQKMQRADGWERKIMRKRQGEGRGRRKARALALVWKHHIEERNCVSAENSNRECSLPGQWVRSWF